LDNFRPKPLSSAFVPADSDRKLEKGFSSGADALLIDLEDSVALSQKPLARERTVAFLRAQTATKERPRLIVRVNSLTSGLIDADLDATIAQFHSFVEEARRKSPGLAPAIKSVTALFDQTVSDSLSIRAAALGR
jgi:hypothetical protein